MINNKTKEFIKRHFTEGKVVMLTGAGVSAASGISTFRGEGGLWEKYDPETYAYLPRLLALLSRNPGAFADFVCDFYSMCLQAKPNHAHLAMAVLEKLGIARAVITQNIDNLHQAAGSRSVIELHGNAFKIKCIQCQQSVTLEKQRIEEFVQLFKKYRDSRVSLMKVISRYFPLCGSCRYRFRIDVVFFGELLSSQAMAKAYTQLDNCGCLLLAGTSLLVQPAASLPFYAKSKGAKLVEINKETTGISKECDFRICGEAEEVLPRIVDILDRV